MYIYIIYTYICILTVVNYAYPIKGIRVQILDNIYDELRIRTSGVVVVLVSGVSVVLCHRCSLHFYVITIICIYMCIVESNLIYTDTSTIYSIPLPMNIILLLNVYIQQLHYIYIIDLIIDIIMILNFYLIFVFNR